MTEGLLSPDNALLAEHIGERRVCAFVSPTVNRLYGERLRGYFRTRLPASSWTLSVIPAGEQNKSLVTVEQVCASAKEAALDRNGVMVAIGGGVTTDVVGFAASIYARGVRYIRLNTTLVGQVDAGVGVKTGVNALGSKNMFGAYHAPHASINDAAFLDTLPRRDVLCGLAEIIKMAVIRDDGLFRSLEQHPGIFHRDARPRRANVEEHVIRTSIRLMLEELCPNLRELNLARPVDFGHTFSPAIETASGYRVAHGEAVAIDMAVSSHLARLLGICDAEECERIVDLIVDLGLPIFDETCTPELMQHALRASWERRGRRLNIVVPTRVGSIRFIDDLDDLPGSAIEETLKALQARVRSVGGRFPVSAWSSR
jgi:3-dehydroquinate synthase